MSLTRASGPDASTDSNAAAGDAFDLADIECSELAPVLAAYLRGHAPGTLVVVRTERESAMEGIRSWCRLTGNLLECEAEHDEAIDFHIRRKRPKAQQGT